MTVYGAYALRECRVHFLASTCGYLPVPHASNLAVVVPSLQSSVRYLSWPNWQEDGQLAILPRRYNPPSAPSHLRR